MIEFKEHEFIIILKREELNIKEKFDIIFNEIILLKKLEDSRINDKLKNLEELILDIKLNINKKLEENENIINKLKSKIEENKTLLEKNNKNINILKKEIFIKNNSEFIKKYNLNKDDLINNKLDLKKRNIDDKEIENLKNIDFKELKVLVLNNNNISDIKVLEKVKFEKLEKLNLEKNNISKEFI